MKCGYCLQTNEKSPADHKADPEVFAVKLYGFLKEPPMRISYWGGEPMLHWRSIRTIHGKLIELGIAPLDKSIITTNGTMISDDYIQYANEHPDMWTVVSAHGWHLTDEQLDRIFRLKRFSISDIVHHGHTDLWDFREMFYRLKGKYGRSPKLCAHFLRANDGCSADFYLSKDDIDSFCAHIQNEVIPMARMGDEWAQWQLRQLLFERDRVLRRAFGPMCVRDDVLSVDLHGNRYECHHNYSADNIKGNIFKKVISIRSAPQFHPERFFNTEECKNCSILNECRGGCYTSNTHELDCYFARKRHGLYQGIERLKL